MSSVLVARPGEEPIDLPSLPSVDLLDGYRFAGERGVRYSTNQGVSWARCSSRPMPLSLSAAGAAWAAESLTFQMHSVLDASPDWCRFEVVMVSLGSPVEGVAPEVMLELEEFTIGVSVRIQGGEEFGPLSEIWWEGFTPDGDLFVASAERGVVVGAVVCLFARQAVARRLPWKGVA